MNKERLAMVRDAIAANPDEYDQVSWLHRCGTPACIAGWAAHLSLEEGENLKLDTNDEGRAYVMRGSMIVGYVNDRARKWLDLGWTQANTMFMSWPFGEEADRSPNPDEAVAMLGHAIKTGEVLWLEDA